MKSVFIKTLLASAVLSTSVCFASAEYVAQAEEIQVHYKAFKELFSGVNFADKSFFDGLLNKSTFNNTDLVCEKTRIQGINFVKCRAAQEMHIYDYRVTDNLGECDVGTYDGYIRAMAIITTYRAVAKGDQFRRYFNSDGTVTPFGTELKLYEMYVRGWENNVLFELLGETITLRDFLLANHQWNHNVRNIDIEKRQFFQINTDYVDECSTKTFEIVFKLESDNNYHYSSWTW